MAGMEKPLHRVLTALELLQAQPVVSGAELAERIGVDRRTVRRYIVELEKLGVPIRATRGRDGHYALMPGYKLPPLMFTNEETLALSVGLRVARELGLSDMTPAVASTQAKLDRVMPKTLRRKIGDLSAVVALDLARPQAESGSEFFAEVARCAGAAQRILMTYCARDGNTTEREVNPYGIGYLSGAWYVVGYCHMRKDLRSFRLDRVRAVQAMPRTFAKPKKFDVLNHLRESIAALPRAHAVVVKFHAAMADVRRAIPSSLGKLSEHANHVRLDAQADELLSFARELLRFNLDFSIVKPKALKLALAAHLRQLLKTHG
jgi:predicted DNA-binding transcriptional regulator YafY